MPFILTINNITTPSSFPTTQQQKLIASDADDDDLFGQAVSISSDGNTVIVGATLQDEGGNNAGAAYIFTRSGGSPNWTEQQKLTASDAEADDEFGYSVALSSDGNTAIVGAHFEDTGGSNAGAAYVFTRSGGSPNWTEQQKLTASDAEDDDTFGSSVSISSDGNTAIVGADIEGIGGAAYIFTRSGGSPNWTEQQKLTASDAQSGDRFGESVSISSDGNTAIVGAYEEDEGGSDAGAAYVFTRSGGSPNWTEQQKLTASDATGGESFGISVSISSDGNTAIVGAQFENEGGNNAGAAYIFTRSGGTWTQQQKLLGEAAGDQLGVSVSISSDGNTAIVGAHLEDEGAFSAGAAYIYTRSGGTWTQQQKLIASDAGSSDQFGISVSISGDGSSTIVGARQDDDGGNNAGAAYIFV